MVTHTVSMCILPHTLYSIAFRALILWCKVEQTSLSRITYKHLSRVLLSGDEEGHSSLLMYSQDKCLCTTTVFHEQYGSLLSLVEVFNVNHYVALHNGLSASSIIIILFLLSPLVTLIQERG